MTGILSTESCKKMAKFAVKILFILHLFTSSASSAPIKLVADFPSFAFSLLSSANSEANDGGHLEQRQLEQASALLLASSSLLPLSSYVGRSASNDDDTDELESTSLAPVTILYEPSTQNVTTNPAQTNSVEGEKTSQVTPVNNKSNSSIQHLRALSGRVSHVIRLPNGQTFQFCREASNSLGSGDDEADVLRGEEGSENGEPIGCLDKNAVCTIGACVCKPGFFSNRQTGECQSFSDLLNNCENDHQCQAINVDLICDTKSHERPFCDCADGLYFDQDEHICLPCDSSTLIKSTTKDWADSFRQNSEPLQESSGNHSAIIKSSTPQTSSAVNSTTGNATSSTVSSANPKPSAPQLRPCKPIEAVELDSWRRQEKLESLHRRNSLLRRLQGKSFAGSPSSTSTSGSSSSSISNSFSTSSDPFRIKTPLEVFMGAIMLFTLVTVAWFFLHRMIHDCRAILRSLRHPEFVPTTDANFTGSLTRAGGLLGANPLAATTLAAAVRSQRGWVSSSGTTTTTTNHLYFDPTGQAVARLFSGDSAAAAAAAAIYAGSSAPFSNLNPASIYQRDLAGVMVQHLTNLSSSSTSHALSLAPNSRSTFSVLPPSSTLVDQDGNSAALYNSFSANSQSRNAAAAAAAAQLLLAPAHPAIALLRAAAAAQSPNSPDYVSANLLSSMFDPPPKYEEAIAQANSLDYNDPRSPSPPPPIQVVHQHQSQQNQLEESTNLDHDGENRAELNQQTQLLDDQLQQQILDEHPIDLNNSRQHIAYAMPQAPDVTLSAGGSTLRQEELCESSEPVQQNLEVVTSSSTGDQVDSSRTNRQPSETINETLPIAATSSGLKTLNTATTRRINRRSRRGRAVASSRSQQEQDSDETSKD